MTYLSKGSKWNKWDFHVHTPFSELNNGFGTNWDDYIKSLFKKAIEKEVKAIGITDYFTIEGYKKIKTEYLEVDEKLEALFSLSEIDFIKKIFVFPNIEFRLNHLVDGNRVNFHVIFSNEASFVDIEENFLHELDFLYEGNIQGEDESWKLKLNNLEQLGKKLKSEHAKFRGNSDMYVGMKCAVVDHSQISRILSRKKSKFKDKYLLVVPSDEDLSEISWDGQGHNVRKVMIQKADALFASNENTIKWALGKFEDADSFINEFKSLKPTIWGSDSHDYSELFKPDLDRYCWIKAQLTFNGLRQIIFEPEERVFIGETPPEHKSSYHLIKEIKFIDSQFNSASIPINSNLVTIIGGKSTGKSILLRNIARTIDSKEVSDRLEECSILDYNKRIEDFRVVWADNQIQELSNPDALSKKIIYIPQSYLNRLVDTPENNSSIDEIIINVLKQDKKVEEVFNSIETFERDNQKTISQEVNNVYYLIEDVKKQNEKIKEVGDETGIKEEIKKLDAEILDLKQKSGLSDDEISLYNHVIKSISDNNDQIAVINADVGQLNNYSSSELLIERTFDVLSEEVNKELTASFEEIRKRYNSEWLEIVKTKKTNLEDRVKKLTESNGKLKGEIESLVEKVKSHNLLNQKINKQKEETEKLKEIQKQQKVRSSLVKSVKEKLTLLKTLHKSYFENLITSRDEILGFDNIDPELEFNLEVKFKKNSFQSSFVEHVLNQKQLSKYLKVGLSPYSYQTNTQFEDNVETMLYSLINGGIVLKNNYSHKEAILKLLENWYIFDFQIKHNGDNISDMSPGKKSFVLLKLLIELDSSKCPILLDQPEDDLDNRSIYYDLVSFIRTKKKERQIIIATHNPNLVVSSDAEQVIVANQHGDKAPNRNNKFEYVSGALENSFISENDDLPTLEKQGIQEHVCDILEGGRKAFEQRMNKYNIN